MDGIKVSVFCLVYNHEKYLRKCLDGFIMQKTNFEFEVLINDDASTDESAGIIREYEKKYPDIIKPIYQMENQYSKGVRIIGEILLPLAKGDYIAFCEGDDYWTDENKLQRQYDILEKNLSYSICTHYVEKILENGQTTNAFIPKIDNVRGCYTLDEYFSYVLENEQLYFQLSSYFIRANYMYDFEKDGSFPELKNIGDIRIFLYSLCHADMYVIPNTMSKYRLNSVSSWTRAMNDVDKRIDTICNIISFYESFNEYTNKKYQNAIDRILLRENYKLVLTKKDYRMLMKPKYFAMVMSEKGIRKIKLIGLIFFSFFKSKKKGCTC